MAIKLYKSSLTPTVKTSNVEDRRQISLTEAQSVGKAMKGMLHSGEKSSSTSFIQAGVFPPTNSLTSSRK